MSLVRIEKRYGRIVKEVGLNISMRISVELESPTSTQIADRSQKALDLCRRLVEKEIKETLIKLKKENNNE